MGRLEANSTQIEDVAAPVPSSGGDFTHRWYAETGQIHSYLKAELADPAVDLLLPRCGSGFPYPTRHARVYLSSAAAAGDRFQWCPACAVAARRTRPARSL